MQPKIDIEHIEQGGESVEALRLTPIVAALLPNGIGKPMRDPNPRNMPREPLFYALTDPEEAKLLRALATPSRQASDFYVYRGAYDKAAALATIARINAKMEAQGMGSAIVVDEVGSADSLSFSLRHKADIWGAMDPAFTWREGRKAAPPKAAAPKAAAPELPGVDLTPAVRPLRGRERAALQDNAIGERYKPKRTVVRRLAQRLRARPEWMRADPLPAPDVKTVFTLPDVRLDRQEGKDGMVLRITPTDKHVNGQQPIALTINDPDHVKILTALLANPRGTIPAEDIDKALPLGAVSCAVRLINGALRDVCAGVCIYRHMTQHVSGSAPRDDNNDRLSLHFDARYWGPVPPEMATRNSQESSYDRLTKPRKPRALIRQTRRKREGVDLSAARNDYANLPTMEYQADNAFQPGRLVITPKVQHEGIEQVVLELNNDIEAQLVKGALQHHRSTQVAGLFAVPPLGYEVSHAARRLNRRLVDLNAGVQLREFRYDSGSRILFQYDAQKWGPVRRALAIKGTLPPPRTHNIPAEPVQLSLALRRISNRWLRRKPMPDDQPVLPVVASKPAYVDTAKQLKLPFGRLREMVMPPRNNKLPRKPSLFEPEQLVLRVDVTTNSLHVGAATMALDDRHTLLLKTLPRGGVKSLHSFQKDLGAPLADRNAIKDELTALGKEISALAGRPVLKVGGDIALARATRLECVGG